MNIASNFNAATIAALALVTILVMTFARRLELIKNVADPFLLMHFQLIFTAILLFTSNLLPIEHAIYLIVTYLLISKFWQTGFSKQERPNTNWSYCIALLILISIPANIYLLLSKGFILFQEDVGAAKVEFYQGAGIIRRINTALSILLPTHIFNTWMTNKKWTSMHTIGITYSLYVILSLGSKAGIASLIFTYGAALYFHPQKNNAKSVFLLAAASVLSSLGMFYLVYGNSFLIDLVTRVVAFADGPFYFFQDKMKIEVPLGYPYYIFGYATRILDALPVTSLGPEINWQYFGLNNDLYGPNPQITVESITIYGRAAALHYASFVIFVLLFTKLANNPYTFTLWATFIRSFPIDSQLAYSNLYNILFVILIYAAAILIRKVLTRQTITRPRMA